MGILFSAYRVLRDEVYRKIPEISCQACGQCCVSPHMTMIEFCYMVTFLRDKPDYLTYIISRMVPNHSYYPNLLTCRFQTPDNLCSIYPNRPLACRLHGHPVMSNVNEQYRIYCQKARPIDRQVSMDEVHCMLDRIAELNQGYYSYYTPPYWISGLNTESWLTVLFTEIPKHVFRLLRKIMSRELDIQHIPTMFNQPVHLQDKLVLIDRFQSEFSCGNYQVLGALLEEIQHHFPETGAYYFFEAEMYRMALEEKKVQALIS